MSIQIKRNQVDGSRLRIPSNNAFNFPDGNFTVEARVKPGKGSSGPVLQRKDPANPGEFDFVLAITGTGDLQFQVRSQGGQVIQGSVALKEQRPPIDLLDGNWHQIGAAHSGGDLYIFADGTRFHARRATDPLRIALSSTRPLYVGSTLEDAAQWWGEVDEVRVWQARLGARQVLAGTGVRLMGGEHHLVGYWPLDDGTARDVCERSDGVPEGSDFVESVALQHLNGPFADATADLVRDYELASEKGADPDVVSRIHVKVTVCNHDRSPWLGRVKLWATAPTTATVNGAEVRLTDNVPVEVTTDVHGQLHIQTIPPDELHFPVLKMNAGFMHSQERLFVYCDEALHRRMQQISGPELQKKRDGPKALLDPDRFNADQAAAVSSTMSKMMGQVVQPVQPHKDNGPRRPKPHPDHSRSPHWHQNPGVLISGYDRKSEAVRLEHGREHGAPPRKLQSRVPTRELAEWSLGQDRVEYFELSFDRSSGLLTESGAPQAVPTFTSLSAAEYAKRRKQLGAGDEAEAGLAEASAESIWDSFVNALKGAVTTLVQVAQKVVEDVITGITCVVQTITTTIKLIGEKVAEFVVETVEQAVSFVKGVFRQLAVELRAVVDFFRSFFNWDDIRRTKEVISHVIDQGFAQFGTLLGQMEELSDKFFDDLKGSVKKDFDKAKEALTGKHATTAAASRSAGELVPGSQSHWLSEKVRNNLGNATLPQLDVDGAALAEVESDIETAIKDFTEGLVDKDVLVGLKDAWSSLKSAISHPEEAVALLLTALLDLLKAATLATLNVAKFIVGLMLKIVRKSIKAVSDLFNSEIQIPLVTWLYETYIDPGKKMTVQAMFSFVLAIPATLVYRLATDNKAPFTDDDVTAIKEKKFTELMRQKRGEADAASSPVERAVQAIVLVSGLAANFLAGAVTMAGDAAQAANFNKTNSGGAWRRSEGMTRYKGALDFVKLPKECEKVDLWLTVPALFAQFCFAPVKFTGEEFTEPEALESVFWCWGVASLYLDAMLTKLGEKACALVPEGIQDKIKERVGESAIKPLLGTIVSRTVAVITFAFSFGLAAQGWIRGDRRELVDVTLSANVLGAAPGLFTWLAFPALVDASEGITIGVLLVIDGAGSVASSALTLAAALIEGVGSP